MKIQPRIAFDNSYVRLPTQFYSRQNPSPVTDPGLITVNQPLARQLNIDPDWLASEEGVQTIAGNEIPSGAEPIATAYAGHQFGGWVPQLGDGRAILLGEVIGEDGMRYDLQLKGSGPTCYSRGGDGRSPLGPVMREYIVSEAMAALQIRTTRALAAVTTGESVMRERRLPGAILARVAQSHIRIGTFQFFAARNDDTSLQLLTDHVIERHYPDVKNGKNPPLAMFELVLRRQADLVAHWMSIGFIHGVMNTDNMLLSGETIDYGPCALMDTFDPATVFSSIDRQGRYAYGNQPAIAYWNLAQLAQALLPVIAEDQETAVADIQNVINRYPEVHEQAYRGRMMQKIGFGTIESGDERLLQELLELMSEQKTDFTLTFRRLSDLVDPSAADGGGVGDLIELSGDFDSWLEKWRQRIDSEPLGRTAIQQRMYAVNPAFIPRNHLVEEVIAAGYSEQEFGPFHKLNQVLARPFHFDPDQSRFATPPRPDQVVSATFCGT